MKKYIFLLALLITGGIQAHQFTLNECAGAGDFAKQIVYARDYMRWSEIKLHEKIDNVITESRDGQHPLDEADAKWFHDFGHEIYLDTTLDEDLAWLRIHNECLIKFKPVANSKMPPIQGPAQELSPMRP